MMVYKVIGIYIYVHTAVVYYSGRKDGIYIFKKTSPYKRSTVSSYCGSLSIDISANPRKSGAILRYYFVRTENDLKQSIFIFVCDSAVANRINLD